MCVSQCFAPWQKLMCYAGKFLKILTLSSFSSFLANLYVFCKIILAPGNLSSLSFLAGAEQLICRTPVLWCFCKDVQGPGPRTEESSAESTCSAGQRNWISFFDRYTILWLNFHMMFSNIWFSLLFIEMVVVHKKNHWRQ